MATHFTSYQAQHRVPVTMLLSAVLLQLNVHCAPKIDYLANSLASCHLRKLRDVNPSSPDVIFVTMTFL